MYIKIRIFCIVLLSFVFCCHCAFGEYDSEDVSIQIFSEDGSLVTTLTSEEENNNSSFSGFNQDCGYSPSVSLTMSFTGDVTIGSNMQHSGVSIFEKELVKQDGDINFPFRNTRGIFFDDDMTMVNFEGTLTTAEKNPQKHNNSFLFRADPSYVTMLSENGIDAVSLENNHVLDMGVEGFAETVSTIESVGVSCAYEAQPAIIRVKGIKIGCLAYQTFNGRHDELIAKVPNDIAKLRSLGCSVVVVSYHWGEEKAYKPNKNQVRLGRATIDAGADLVIGHHSHRINPIEYYNGKYICYSLGNFSFAGNNKPDDMSTYIFQIQMSVTDGVATSEQFRIIPCRISSQMKYNDFSPTPYTKQSDVDELLRKLKKNSIGLEYAVDNYPLNWDMID